MYASVTHIIPMTAIRRKRRLPIPGRVVARKGQKVSANDVIAEANLAPEHILLNIARGLSLRDEIADGQLQVKAGDQVSEGDVLAGPVGMTKRVVRAPRNGRVILAGGGEVLLEVASPKFELRAGLPGVVSELLDGYGAVIENNGALVQGVWGNGRQDSGLMIALARSPGEELTPDRLDVSLRGSLVIAGICRDAAVLQAAEELPLRGLVLASLEGALLPLAAKMSYPVLVIDGFGPIPMNSAAFRLLSANDRQEVALNAEPWNRYTGVRPELFIPLPAEGELSLPSESGLLTPGQQVRVVRAPYRGKIGTLFAMRPGMTVLPNGIHALTGEVQLESGETIVSPLANLEILT